MTTSKSSSEPHPLGPRFYRAMQARALMLEIDALRDELAAAAMENPGQVRRQRLLIQAQRDEAERLRGFLARTCIQPDAGTSQKGAAGCN